MGGERLDTRNPTRKLMLTILAGVATTGWRCRAEGVQQAVNWQASLDLHVVAQGSK
jgi:hypothetical protein